MRSCVRRVKAESHVVAVCVCQTQWCFMSETSIVARSTQNSRLSTFPPAPKPFLSGWNYVAAEACGHTVANQRESLGIISA